MNISGQVRETFRRLSEGGVIASRELHRLSTESRQVDKAASRLYKTEGLVKLRNGLFYKPSFSKYFGNLPPREKDIIRSLKRQYNARIYPSGHLAAYELGLVYELPDQIIYETDKRIGSISFNDYSIHFRKVDSKKLSATPGKLLTLFNALAFMYKSERKFTPLQRRRITRLLNSYTSRQIQQALTHWPRWFQMRIQAFVEAVEQRYITGLSALNIPYRGGQADWHQMGMLYSNKFHIAGKNYEGAPGLTSDELFDCSGFLKKRDINLETNQCATPLRAVKDILYNNIIRKQQYPGFFMLDQFMLDIDNASIITVVNELKQIADSKQQALLDKWVEENELN